MNHSEIEQFLTRLEDESSWLQQNAFAGESDEMRGFVSKLNCIASLSNDPANPELVLFARVGECQRIDNAVIETLGYSVEQTIKLYPGCDVHNHRKLFGDAIESSILERNNERIVVTGFEYLSPRVWSRFVRHLTVWLSQHPRKLLLVGESFIFPEDSEKIMRKWTTELEFPRLKDRKQDIIYELHLAARACDGRVDRFSLDALNFLLKQDWDGDVRDVEQVVFRVFRESSDEREISVDQVRVCLKRKSTVRLRQERTTDTTDLWRRIVSLREDIDRLSTSLIGNPFFAQRAETTTQRPLGSGCPELDFFRLISWAYMMLIECGSPNVAIVGKLATGLRVQIAELMVTCDTIGRLRTFLQHSLQYGSKSDQQTIELASKWFDNAVGRFYPLEQDYEICIIVMLQSVAEAFEKIHQFLQKLNEDEYKHTILRQWKDRVEDVWPKHQYDSAICKALRSLNRTDLDLESLCRKLLPKMQERLKITSKDADRHKAMQEYAEHLIEETFPSKKTIEKAVVPT